MQLATKVIWEIEVAYLKNKASGKKKKSIKTTGSNH